MSVTEKQLNEIRARCELVKKLTKSEHVPLEALQIDCLTYYPADVSALLDALVKMAQRDIPSGAVKRRTAVGDYMCPNCGVAFIDSPSGGPVCETPYCGNCGQRLEWKVP